MNKREELKQVHDRLASALELNVRRLVPGVHDLMPESASRIHKECRSATKRLAQLIVNAHAQRKYQFSHR